MSILDERCRVLGRLCITQLPVLPELEREKQQFLFKVEENLLVKLFNVICLTKAHGLRSDLERVAVMVARLCREGRHKYPLNELA